MCEHEAAQAFIVHTIREAADAMVMVPRRMLARRIVAAGWWLDQWLQRIFVDAVHKLKQPVALLDERRAS
jgi:hypothetical protein